MTKKTQTTKKWYVVVESLMYGVGFLFLTFFYQKYVSCVERVTSLICSKWGRGEEMKFKIADVWCPQDRWWKYNPSTLKHSSLNFYEYVEYSTTGRMMLLNIWKCMNGWSDHCNPIRDQHYTLKIALLSDLVQFCPGPFGTNWSWSIW